MSVEYYKTSSEKIKSAIYNMTCIIKHFFDLCGDKNNATFYEPLKKQLLKIIDNESQKIISVIDKLKNRRQVGAKVTEPLRNMLPGDFYKQFNLTLTCFEKLPPGNSFPSPEKTACFKQEYDKLLLNLQKLERYAEIIEEIDR